MKKEEMLARTRRLRQLKTIGRWTRGKTSMTGLFLNNLLLLLFVVFYDMSAVRAETAVRLPR